MEKSIIAIQTYPNFTAYENHGTIETLLLDENELPFLKLNNNLYNAVVCSKDRSLVIYERITDRIRYFIPLEMLKFFKFISPTQPL